MKAWVYVGAAVLVLGVGTAVVLAGGGGSSTRSPSLPRRIGTPSVFSDYAPIGSASVAFSSSQWHWDGTIDTIAVTGATDDRYRMLRNAYESTAGESAILSPDGRRLAVMRGVVDLSTDTLTVGAPRPGAVPQAWSADGRYLATVSYVDVSLLDNLGRSIELDIVDTRTGDRRRIVLDLKAPIDGWLAAFAPDGRLAYQSGDTITVVDRDGKVLHDLRVPHGARIAGKGAWTPDGGGITVVDRAHQASDSRWTLTTLNASDGAAIGSAYHVDGVVGVRMLGWSAAGRPVVVAYDPLPPDQLDPGTTPVDLDNPDNPYSLGNLDEVRAVRVLELWPGGGSQLLCDASAQSIDIADNVLSGGLGRPGDPPLLTLNVVIVGTILAIITVLVLVIVLAVWALSRKRRPPEVDPWMWAGPPPSDLPAGAAADGEPASASRRPNSA